MGFRVESYSVEELHRIAVPGAAPPSLFWILPVGPWYPHDLEQIWHHFTGPSSGNCSAYGLLLVKDFQRRHEPSVPVNLGSVGASLSDIIPRGADRFVSPSAMRAEPCRLMILSGAYPQPGWGVLIDRRSVEPLEELLNLVITKLRGRAGESTLNVFEDATHAYHRLREIVRAEPRASDVRDVDQTITSGQSARAKLAAAEKGFVSHSSDEVTIMLFTALGALQSAQRFGLDQNEVDTFADLHRKRNGARSILAVSDEKILALKSVISTLLTDPAKKADAFQRVETEDEKRALKASLYALENKLVRT